MGKLGIGTALQEQGDLSGALSAYRDALAINERLANSNYSNSRLQHTLARNIEVIGVVSERQGDLAGALAAFRKAAAIAKAAAQRQPDNTDWQQNVAVIAGRIGGVLRRQGDRTGALAAFRDAQTTFAALAAKDPGNTIWSDDLAVADEKIGEALQATNDLGRPRGLPGWPFRIYTSGRHASPIGTSTGVRRSFPNISTGVTTRLTSRLGGSTRVPHRRSRRKSDSDETMNRAVSGRAPMVARWRA